MYAPPIPARTEVAVTFSVREPDHATLVDITGLVPTLRVSTSPRDSAPFFVSAAGSIISGPLGTCLVSIPATALLVSGEYWAELSLTLAGVQKELIGFYLYVTGGALA